MFGIGFPEFILIVVVGLVVLGPEKLPELAKKVVKIINDIKKAADELKNQLDEEKTAIDAVKPENLQKKIYDKLAGDIISDLPVDPLALKPASRNVTGTNEVETKKESA